MKEGEFSIQSLKDHCKFISFLADLPSIAADEYSQLMVSLAVTETVRSHSFYVKKVVDNETVFRVIRIYRGLVGQGPEGQGQGQVVSQGQAVGLGAVRLCLAVAEKKEKKMQLLCDE